MNYLIVFKLLSVIMAAMAVAFGVSYGVGEWLDSTAVAQHTRMAWLGSIALALLLTLIFWALGRKAVPKLFRKEALAVIGIGWVLASALGAFPYFLILQEASYADGFFEAASGLTTTGSTVFAAPEDFPLSLLFWRCLSQWIGGLGVVVFFVAILSYLGAGAKILYANESSGSYAELGSGRVQSGIMGIVYFYLALSAACAVTLRLTGLEWFDAVCVMLATVCTGGFSNYGTSIAHYANPAVEWVLIFYMFIGGCSFLLILRAITGGGWRVLRRNTELKAYCGIILAATVALTIMLVGAQEAANAASAFRLALFQTVSIITTTGFATADFEMWLPFGHVVLVLLMLFGGCSGSTSGSIKIVRIVVVVKSALRHIERAFRSRVVRPLHINGRVLAHEEQDDIQDFVILMLILMVVGSLLLAVLEPHVSPEGTISAIVTSLCNVGPGLNEVGPAHTFADFGAAAKVLLAVFMIMGRVELYALLALFFPSLWKKFS